MQHKESRRSSVWYLLVGTGVRWEASSGEYDVAPASPGPFERSLEHGESIEAARPEARGERAEPAAPEPVSASEDVTRPEDVPERREHELLRIDGIPADSYPFLPTHRTVDVHVRHCRRCGASCDRLRLHFGEQSEVNVFCEYLCSACA